MRAPRSRRAAAGRRARSPPRSLPRRPRGRTSRGSSRRRRRDRRGGRPTCVSSQSRRAVMRPSATSRLCAPGSPHSTAGVVSSSGTVLLRPGEEGAEEGHRAGPRRAVELLVVAYLRERGGGGRAAGGQAELARIECVEACEQGAELAPERPALLGRETARRAARQPLHDEERALVAADRVDRGYGEAPARERVQHGVLLLPVGPGEYARRRGAADDEVSRLARRRAGLDEPCLLAVADGAAGDAHHLESGVDVSAKERCGLSRVHRDGYAGAGRPSTKGGSPRRIDSTSAMRSRKRQRPSGQRTSRSR